MRTSILTTRLTTIALVAATLLISCQKDQSGEALSPQQEEQATSVAAESEAESEGSFDEVFDNVMGVNAEVGLGGTGVFGGRLSGDVLPGGRIEGTDSARCFTVTITQLVAGTAFPVRITTDFGAAGCKGRDGRTRYGKIITTYTGRLIEPGKSATTTFENYRVDSISVSGTHTITNTGTATTRQYTVEVTNAKLTRPNGNYIQRSARRVITQVEGLATPLIATDDVFRIEGAASGTAKRGTLAMSWESTITEPLIKRFSCPWIVKGKVEVIRRGQNRNSPWMGLLDYGTGSCDNRATLTVNGVVRQIILH
jgi:hypothetical protein